MSTPVAVAESVDKTNIPTNVTECITQLKSTLPKATLDRLRSQDERFVSEYGVPYDWLRGRDSKLREFFFKRGIHSLEDMSFIITTSLWKDLHCQPIRLQEQIDKLIYDERLLEPQVIEERSITQEVLEIVLPTDKGQTIKLSASKGKVIVLAILWLDESSKAIVSTLNSLDKSFSKNNVEFVGLLQQPPALTDLQKTDFLRDTKPTFPVVTADEHEFVQKVAKSLIAPGTVIVPQTIVISKNQHMIARFNGWEPGSTPALLIKAVNEALKK